MTGQETCITSRSDSLFEKSMNANYQATNKWFAGLFVFQWIAGIVAALCLSPTTWQGASWTIHPHVWQAVLLGGLTAAVPIYMIRMYPVSAATRHVVAVGQVLASSLLIHISGGRIETHFHIFGSLAFLAFYRDWKILISASAIVALDHLLRGLYFPESVYGVLLASPWRTVEHALWVVFEDVFLIAACLRSTKEMRSISTQQAELESTNEIIERKVSEQVKELTRSEAQTRMILDTTNDAILTLSGDGTIRSANAMAVETFNLNSANELTGKDVNDLISFRGSSGETMDFKKFADAYWNDVASVTRNIDVCNRDGESLPLELTLNKTLTEDDHLYVLLARNVMNQKRAELRLMAIQSVMCNKLQNHVGAARAAFELSRSDSNALEAQNTSHLIEHGIYSAYQAATVVQDLIDLQNFTTGNVEFTLKRCNVRKIIDSALSGLRRVAKTANVKLEVTCPTQLDICADEQRLVQIVSKLVSNAVKFTTRGDTIKIIAAPAKNNMVRVLVTDHGPGIPDGRSLDLLSNTDTFEKFDKDRPGLGLPLCKAMINALGGDFGYTSNAGHGCSFWFELSSKSDKVATMEKTSKSALLVANKLHLTDALRASLEKEGYQLLHASNVFDAKALLAGCLPEALVLDLSMPDGQALSVVDQLRNRSETSAMPVIFISSRDLTDDSQTANSSTVGWLSPPVDPAALVKALQEIGAHDTALQSH